MLNLAKGRGSGPASVLLQAAAGDAVGRILTSRRTDRLSLAKSRSHSATGAR